MNISLIGVGMGGTETLTAAAWDALARADVVIGAERLLAGLPNAVAAERVAIAVPDKVAAAIRGNPGWGGVAVVLSGDVGFYSGAKRLLELLSDHAPVLVPGISTPQYFAAKLRRPWQDFRLVSAHGVAPDILAEVLNHPAVLFLTDADTTPGAIAAELRAAGLADAAMTIGENLSTSDERITRTDAESLADGPAFSPLNVVLVENSRTFAKPPGSAGLADDEFIRGGAPMTKREVRALALSLLGVTLTDTVYDIGAGTGSVAVEAALIARRGRVFAVEDKAEAFRLLCANREKFGVHNLCPVHGRAPEALDRLPPPEAMFIGGSGGELTGIVAAGLRKNPGLRLVVSAITLETLNAGLALLREATVKNVEIVQLAASRMVARGGSHLLEARNPVFLISGGGA